MEKITKPRKNLFLCSRTSIWGDGQPCEEAFMINVINTDTRVVDDPSKLPLRRCADTWYEEGTNHRVENGNIKRDMGIKKEWAVEINNIPVFVKKHGESCIINVNEDGYNTIEIYDDYRE